MFTCPTWLFRRAIRSFTAESSKEYAKSRRKALRWPVCVRWPMQGALERNRSIIGTESGAGRKTASCICAGPLLFVSLQRIALRTRRRLQSFINRYADNRNLSADARHDCRRYLRVAPACAAQRLRPASAALCRVVHSFGPASLCHCRCQLDEQRQYYPGDVLFDVVLLALPAAGAAASALLRIPPLPAAARGCGCGRGACGNTRMGRHLRTHQAGRQPGDGAVGAAAGIVRRLPRGAVLRRACGVDGASRTGTTPIGGGTQRPAARCGALLRRFGQHPLHGADRQRAEDSLRAEGPLRRLLRHGQPRRGGLHPRHALAAGGRESASSGGGPALHGLVRA